MPRLSRSEALDNISSWHTADVVAFLQKNGVEEACWKAVEKRQIDGDELLHLTEGKLTLWKSDLTRPLIWSLWTFVEKIKKCPENYLEDKELQPQAEQQRLETDALSDTGSWDTDFEDNVDDVADDGSATEVTTGTMGLNSDFRSSLRLFQENDRIMMENQIRGSSHSINRMERSNDATSLENAYANCHMSGGAQESDSTYANVGYTDTAPRTRPKLHSVLSANDNQRKSLAVKLKEQLMLIGAKPAITPKPKSLCKRSRDEGVVLRSEPRTSFLHKSIKPKLNGTSVLPTSEQQQNQSSGGSESTEKQILPKPPATIRCFDLVANLPTTRPTDESEDEEEEYEAFDEQIVEQHQRNSMMRADSRQSLSSATQNSLESVYHPPSSLSHDDEEVYEIYESITESPEENGLDFKKEANCKNMANPPPLPVKPPPNLTVLQNHLNKANTRTERSPEKKSATLPHSGSKTSLNNVARPLPPPPDKQSYYERPWFHNLTREQANLLIEEQCTYGNSSDGYFLMRPSTSNPNNPLTLVLWCKDRVYNVPVRRRPDNRYALGSSKPNEQSFASIDEIIPFYKRENLVLYTGGVQTGSTRLSDTPSK